MKARGISEAQLVKRLSFGTGHKLGCHEMGLVADSELGRESA